MFVIIVAMLLTGTVCVFADGAVRVKVDGKIVEFPDVQPFIDESNRTQVPVRFVSEALGAKVTWDGKLRVVTIKKDTDTIVLRIGENRAVKNQTEYTLDTKAIIKFDRTFVPLRFVSEVLGANVKWIAATKTVEITTGTVGDTKIVNGYVVPTNIDSGLRVEGSDINTYKYLSEIMISISFFKGDTDVMLQEAEQILLSKLDKSIVDKVMQYARQKTNAQYELELKEFDAGNRYVTVEGFMNRPININVYVKY